MTTKQSIDPLTAISESFYVTRRNEQENRIKTRFVLLLLLLSLMVGAYLIRLLGA